MGFRTELDPVTSPSNWTAAPAALGLSCCPRVSGAEEPHLPTGPHQMTEDHWTGANAV